MNSLAPTRRAPGRTRRVARRPVVFVLDHHQRSFDALRSALTRRFGNDLTVTGATSASAALRALEEMAAAGEPVALLLVDDLGSDFLDRAHRLHPSAKRVFVVDRDYRFASPAVQAM